MRWLGILMVLAVLTGCAGNGISGASVPATHVYAAALPSASGSGRFVELMLFPDSDALFVEAYLDHPKDKAVRAGHWVRSGSYIDLTLDQGETLSFLWQGNYLIYEGNAYGSAGLTLEALRPASSGPGLNIGLGVHGGF
ncbi:hypothetical protein GCM10023116_38360 [Kistimonas scapharcae]|uniref:Uncharacterized protein n=1 Tax=Kistimonas scapharcae TaxID=1036133 RepID=A0ABP8V6P4_9GAMM